MRDSYFQNYQQAGAPCLFSYWNCLAKIIEVVQIRFPFYTLLWTLKYVDFYWVSDFFFCYLNWWILVVDSYCQYLLLPTFLLKQLFHISFKQIELQVIYNFRSSLALWDIRKKIRGEKIAIICISHFHSKGWTGLGKGFNIVGSLFTLFEIDLFCNLFCGVE